jgi:aminoglycoside phosphotransferase family enzyme
MRSFNISLPLSWKREEGDNRLRAFWKSVFNRFLAYLLYILRLMQWFLFKSSYYPIEHEIALTTTRVIFTRSKRTTQTICLKLWQRSDDEVCNDRLVIRDEDYLIEGFAFNRKFAPDVYLGIAPVEVSKNKIKRGRLIEYPELNTLKKSRAEYALVMRCLKENWRLDYHLCQSRLGKDVSIDFIAKEVAYMHWQLENSPGNYGTPESISSKLDLNSGLFLEALSQLSNGQNNLEKYGWISDLMARTCEDYTELFRQRYNDGHIKRCHGDLKATNLWVRPAKTLFFGLKKYPQQLLALDCVDFNPEFCHIDTLSDVAMLAVDIEMHFTNWTGAYKDLEYAQNFANVFLDRYLRQMQEYNMDAWPLLRYYMTEKAMVCAYVSILYDGQPELGERYLDIAYVHAQQLGKPIESSAQVLALGVS